MGERVFFRAVFRFLKVLLGICVVLVVGFFALLVGANWYLQSASVQKKILQATETTLHFPVTMGGVSFTPWGGLVLRDLVAKNPQNPKENRFVAERLNVDFAWGPLLRKKLIITSVSLTNPVVFVPPRSEVVLMPPADKVEVYVPGEVVGKPVAGGQSGGGVPEEGAARPFRFTVEVRKFQVAGGKVVVLDSAGKGSVEFRGVDLEMKIKHDFSFKGMLRVAEASVGGRLLITGVDAPFTRRNGWLQTREARAEWAGGKVFGEWDFEEKTGDFFGKVRVENVGIEEVFADAGFSDSRAAGTLEGGGEWKGGRTIEDLQGAGSFRLVGAKLTPLDTIQQVGNLLRIEELQVLELKDASADWKISGGTLSLEALQLKSENLWICGSGTVGLRDGKLELPSKLLFNKRLQKKLGGFAAPYLTDSEQEGYKEFPFRVYGSVQRPETDILERLGLGVFQKGIEQTIKNLFGVPAGKKKEP